MSKCSISMPSRHRIFHIKHLLSKKDIQYIIDKVNSKEVYDKGSNYEALQFPCKYTGKITEKLRLLGNHEINKILRIIDSNSNTHVTCYKPHHNGMESHYDGWSDWNLLEFIGIYW